ncbi:MAG: SDR family NAD(P)-dependent oxidoreductase [Actinomycetota bacterium]|jgi:NAD(P)-dependent dehydrogenase (short-subunit alcohol dehydrogenase family)|nr:SDR family NAD(P)-dependent oxidoreductase [Actinomycetota bacterium]
MTDDAASLDLPDLDTWGLDGKVVLITGAASGIGAATARLAAGDGANVIVCDLPGSDGQAVADEVGGSFVELDVTSSDNWASVAAGLDRLDIAILNAGVEFRDPADFARTADDPGTWDLDLYHRATNVNIDGVALGMHALVPVFDRLGGGTITVTASLAGLIPWSPDPIYSMTKWAAVGLVRASASPLRRKGITINAVCPGGVATPMTRVFDGTVPPGMADPTHIAKAHLGIAISGLSGRVIKAVAGYAHSPHQFAEVSGTF